MVVHGGNFPRRSDIFKLGESAQRNSSLATSRQRYIPISRSSQRNVAILNVLSLFFCFVLRAFVFNHVMSFALSDQLSRAAFPIRRYGRLVFIVPLPGRKLFKKQLFDIHMRDVQWCTDCVTLFANPTAHGTQGRECSKRVSKGRRNI